MFPSFRRSVLGAVVSLSLLLGGSAHAATVPSYTVAEVWHLPGASMWGQMVVDAERHNLFITRPGSIDVFDISHRKMAGSIPNLRALGNVALAPDLGRGFVVDDAKHMLTSIDLETLNPFQSIAVGRKPVAVAYDPASQRALVSNYEGHDLTVVDATVGNVIGKIDLAGKPTQSVSNQRGSVYVNIEDKAEVAVIDAIDMKVLNYIDLKPACTLPTSLAIDAAHGRLFINCHNKTMVVVNTSDGQILDALPVGAHSSSTAFDPATQLAFSASGEGTLAVVAAVSPTHYKIIQTVATKPTAHSLAIDTSTHQLYLAAAEVDGAPRPDPKQEKPHFRLKPNSLTMLVVKPK